MIDRTVPYNEIYRIAEQAHITSDDEYVQEECHTAANTYGVPFVDVYMSVRKLYMHEFA